MNPIEAEAERAVHAVGNLFRHHTTTAPAAATINTSTPGGTPVSKFSDDLHAVATKLEHIDDDAITALTAVKANPATNDVFAVLRDLTGYNVSPDYITLVTTGLTELRNRLAAAAQQATQQDGQAGQDAQSQQATFTPAGPRVAGQA